MGYTKLVGGFGAALVGGAIAYLLTTAFGGTETDGIVAAGIFGFFFYLILLAGVKSNV